MKPSGHPRRIPNQNVLDLKQLLAEQRAAVRPRRRFALPSRSEPRREWHQPSAGIDWTSLGREGAKFGFVVIVVGIVMALGWRVVQAYQTAGDVQATATSALSELQAGGTALGTQQVADARQHFHAADTQFQSALTTANTKLGLPGGFVRVLPMVGPRYRAALGLLTAGQSLAEAGEKVSAIIASSPRHDLLPAVQTEGVVSGHLGFLSSLLAQGDDLDPIIANVEEARQALTTVDPKALPKAYQEKFRAWQLAEASLIGDDQRLGNFLNLLVGLFGQPQSQEYLVLFQNDDELRPTGGFAGTYLLVKFDHGTFKILDAPVTGPFDLTAQIPKTTLPPDPILAVAPYWTFQDANWFLDVPTSSSLVLDFYEQARGFRPKGVILFSPAMVEDLLDITGPIRPDGYDVDITSENFLRATELQVEFGFDRALNNPKEFLLDLVPALFTKLANLPPAAGLQAVAVFFQHATQSNILFYSEDETVQSTIHDLGWDGAVLEAKDDYLAVVDTNLGGGKTDRVITTSVKAEITIGESQIEHKITIRRENNGQRGDPLTGTTNRDFVRVYAPTNADFKSIDGASVPPATMFMNPAAGTTPSTKLQDLEGTVLVDRAHSYRLTDENGRKVYGAWSLLEPGKKQTLTFTYSTPRPDGNWSLVWQKQPGATPRDWEVVVKRTDGSIGEYSPGSGSQSGNRVSWKTTSDTNRIFSASLK